MVRSSLVLSAVALTAWFAGGVHADTPSAGTLDDGRSHDEIPLSPGPAALELFRGAATDWAALIDTTWGPAPWPIADQLTWFDAVWDKVDQDYPCFEGIVDHWDSLGTAYRAEITAGVSKGRLAAIFNHLALDLQESHTRFRLDEVNSTALAPGVPLMVIGGWGANDHFGAGLTPLPDKSLLVYQAVAAHPLGLVPGDIVLGYEGTPWEQQVQDLLDAELPIKSRFFWGSSPSSLEHSLLMAAGSNWHLFDTIDVVKYDTGDTVNLSTAPLAGASMEIYCTEQLPIPGVGMTDVPNGKVVARGRPLGTNVGYIYVAAWSGNAETKFLSAVNALYDTAGLIIDFRTNYGGNMFLSDPALAVLFDQVVPTINWDERCPGGGHLDMCSSGIDSTFYDIPGDPATSYDKPIAVLVGPGAVSSGDQVALRMELHPHARVFGKSTATAFNAPVFDFDTGGGPIVGNIAVAEAYRLSDPGNHLTHDEFIIDESVWLMPDDVAQGLDTVVEAALDWVRSQVTAAPDLTAAGRITSLSNFPNPFTFRTTIRYSIAGEEAASLSIFDVSGRLVRTFDVLRPGDRTRTWDGRDQYGNPLAAGVYFSQVTQGARIARRRMLLVK